MWVWMVHAQGSFLGFRAVIGCDLIAVKWITSVSMYGSFRTRVAIAHNATENYRWGEWEPLAVSSVLLAYVRLSLGWVRSRSDYSGCAIPGLANFYKVIDEWSEMKKGCGFRKHKIMHAMPRRSTNVLSTPPCHYEEGTVTIAGTWRIEPMANICPSVKPTVIVWAQ